MKKSELIDMFGLRGDTSSNDQLDDLLFRLESDIPNVLETHSKVTCLSSITTITIASFESDDFLGVPERRNRVACPEQAGGLLYESLSASMRLTVAS